MTLELARQSDFHPHDPLSDRDLQRVIDGIFQLMREVGVKFEPNPWVMDIFSDAGCDISQDGIVRFPTDLVVRCIDSAGRSVKLWNRPGSQSIEIRPESRVFMAMASCLNMIDIGEIQSARSRFPVSNYRCGSICINISSSINE